MRMRTFGVGSWPWRRVVLSWAILTTAVPSFIRAQEVAPRVALVLDQETARLQPMVEAFRDELRGFFRPGEITLLSPLAGDGTTTGVQRVLRGALGDSSVSVVITLGPIGSHLLARTTDLAKPAIAAGVVDASWQGIPQRDGVSGVRNLTYVDQSYPVGATLVDFHRILPFRRIAVVLDSVVVATIPRLASGAAELVRAVGAEAVIVRAGTRAEAIWSALPAGVDAVYLTPIPGMPEAELAVLLDSLAARRLPTLSYTVNPEVTAGALASYEPPENWRRRARRVAVDLQRIIAGEDAGRLPVQLVSAPRLTFNLATARRIGFSPGYSLLTDAELVGVDSMGPADTLTLTAAMRSAVEANLDLAAARLEAEAGKQGVRLARSGLLPQVESQLGGTLTREGTAAASLGQQPERRLDGGLTMSVPLYSERAWAGYGSEQRRQQSRDAQRDRVRLDVVQSAAAAYLNVRRAIALADVRRTNLYRTRSNLEVARMREGVGRTSRADVYRWEGEVANARRDLIAAEAQVRVAALELLRLLNRPLGSPVAQQPTHLTDPALLARDSTVLQWLEDPEGLQALTGLLVSEAFRLSPELVSAEAAIAATRRQHTAAGRAYWLPTFTLEGGVTDVLSRGGAGRASPVLPDGSTLDRGPDLSWQVRLKGSLPLFTGGARGATREQARLEVERLETARDAIRLVVEQRIRAALELAASSYAAIALTRDAARAAGANYELVSDAYTRGAASITELVDAQSAALTTSEAAANAVHDFLLDLVQVERAMGTYNVLQSPEQQQVFRERLASLKETR
jgi:outer membrane protein TolC